MSNLYFNIRVGLYHFQLDKQFKLRVSKNVWWRGQLTWTNFIWFH